MSLGTGIFLWAVVAGVVAGLSVYCVPRNDVRVMFEKGEVLMIGIEENSLAALK